MNFPKKSDLHHQKKSPLLCWDLFLESYYQKLELAEDKRMLDQLGLKQNWKFDFDIEKQLFRLGKTIVVTRPTLEIVYASSNMYFMNGYHPKEVLGKKPSIFQGDETSEESKKIIRMAVEQRQPFEVMVVNYRKNGETYDCHIQGYPVFNRSRELANFIAFERERLAS